LDLRGERLRQSELLGRIPGRLFSRRPDGRTGVGRAFACNLRPGKGNAMRAWKCLAAGSIVAIVTVVAAGQAVAQTRIHPSTDRRTAADRAMTLPPVRATEGNCLRLCLQDNLCRAWTFIRHEPAENCWLGPARVSAKTDGCCVSGTVR
jgi:hypothetical protein